MSVSGMYLYGTIQRIVRDHAQSALPDAPVVPDPPRRPPRLRLAAARGLAGVMARGAASAAALADRLASRGQEPQPATSGHCE